MLDAIEQWTRTITSVEAEAAFLYNDNAASQSVRRGQLVDVFT